MRFWAREIVGWALVGLGLFVLFWCFFLLMEHYIIEGGPLTIMGIIIFRGGIHMLKVSVAARVCLQAERQLEQQPKVTPGGHVAPDRRTRRATLPARR